MREDVQTRASHFFPLFQTKLACPALRVGRVIPTVGNVYARLTVLGTPG
jgi:hypothetical protein